MLCPRCHQPTGVLESRAADDGAAVRRRRRCADGHRFTTYERREPEPLAVIKRDGRRQRFERAKLRAALERATHKRSVRAAEVEALVDRVELEIEAAGGELEAERIGLECLDGLERLDPGAYLQFLGTMPANAATNTEFAQSPQPGYVRAARKSSSLPAEAESQGRKP